MEGPGSSSQFETNLVDLPRELLMKIFETLPPKHVYKMSRVCRLLNRLIKDDSWWMNQIQRALNGVRLPIAETKDEEFTPFTTRDAIYFEERRWAAIAQETKSITEGSCSHYATIDAVKLFKSSNGARFCITGARDRSLKIFNLDAIKNSPVNKDTWVNKEKEGAHEGWIWSVDLVNEQNELLSAGWDSTVCLWDIDQRPFHCISRKIDAENGAVTGILADEKVAICSRFHSTITIHDINNNLESVGKVRAHQGAITSIAQKGHYIYSYGVDRKLRITDKRNLKEHLSIRNVPNSLNICLNSGLVYLATSSGEVHAYRADNLSPSHNFRVVPDGNAVRQVIKTKGSVLALTQLGGLKSFSLAPAPIEMYSTGKFHCEPCRFDYLAGDVAVGCGDGSVTFWHRPVDL
ncbi:unnamed protein product, partial [Mesorhabditis belari]|uniref:F-box domain-containing protein n=1 Tax=Mesorhabditis belari TaxID=2138241 RepID=A0AAF3EJE9_9BILA